MLQVDLSTAFPDELDAIVQDDIKEAWLRDTADSA